MYQVCDYLVDSQFTYEFIHFYVLWYFRIHRLLRDGVHSPQRRPKGSSTLDSPQFQMNKWNTETLSMNIIYSESQKN